MPDDLNSDLAPQVTVNQRLKSEYAALEQRFAALEARADELFNQREELVNENRDLRISLSEWQHAYTDLAKERNDLRARIEVLRQAEGIEHSGWLGGVRISREVDSGVNYRIKQPVRILRDGEES